MSSLLIYKPKERTASVDRVINEYELIGWNLLEKGGNVQPVRFDSLFDKQFVGLKVVTKGGVEGVIESSFGKAGKFKVVFQKEHGLSKNDEFFIYFRRYVFDKEKKIQQDLNVCFYTILSIL